MPHAVVIGGSVGGLFAANLLGRIGWRVSVFERTERELGDRGAAFGITDELIEVMRRVDPGIDASIGVEMLSRICLDITGEVIAEVPALGLVSAWSLLYRPLKHALPHNAYRAGVALRRVEQLPNGITATFSDGSHATGDLLIAADGLHSTVRQQLLPDAKPRYAGYVVWRAVLNEHSLPPSVHAKIFHHWTFCFPDDGMVLCVPMPGSELGGERRFQIGWFRATDETKLIDLCTDSSGRSHGVSIPSPLIRREIIDALKADAKAALAPEIAALLMQASQVMLQPIFDCESPRIGFDRVALLGDAAFVARPHVAAGVTKAALDAECLARTLAATNNLHTALAQYDSERRPAGRRLVALGRYLGGHLEGSGPEQAKPKRDPTKIIREYGGRLTIDETIITSQMSQPA